MQRFSHGKAASGQRQRQQDLRLVLVRPVQQQARKLPGRQTDQDAAACLNQQQPSKIGDVVVLPGALEQGHEQHCADPIIEQGFP